MCEKTAVALIDADSQKEALEEAEERDDCDCYANQYLSAKLASRASATDIEEAEQNMRDVEESSRWYR